VFSVLSFYFCEQSTVASVVAPKNKKAPTSVGAHFSIQVILLEQFSPVNYFYSTSI